jgi:hypothetical protein
LNQSECPQIQASNKMTFFTTIKTKIEQLKTLDPNLEAFGADTHRYQFNKPVPEADLKIDSTLSCPKLTGTSCCTSVTAEPAPAMGFIPWG